MLLSLASLTVLLSLVIPSRSDATFLRDSPSRCSNSTLPVVNLGYEYHQAISFNTTGAYYNFSNIRYGVAPLGNLRFRAPIGPDQTNALPKINNGSVGRVCPQASGNWSIIASKFAAAYAAGTAFDYDAAMAALPDTPTGVSFDPRTTEDCLFLDVIAPQSGLRGRNSLPVLVWIYGGGYTSGEKSGYGKFNPAGLLEKANNGFVYVAMNYRMGAFGFIGGDEVAANGTTNAALYDQRLALRWVQKYIHLFGGDKNRVTVMGGSAGAGSIMHHITAFAGDDKDETGPLFQQAILQSPAFLPSPTDATPEASFQDLLAFLNISSLEELRGVPGETLITANAQQIYSHSPYGSNMYGPSVDGTIAPGLPGKLLELGKYTKGLKIMVSHNSLEGLLFTKPTLSTAQDYNDLLRQSFAGISEAQIAAVNALYPPIFNGTLGYTSNFQRAMVTIQDVTIVCNTRYLASAMYDRTYGIKFSVPPGIHGQETNYVFNNGDLSGAVKNVADRLQQYIASFVTNLEPASMNGTALPLYGLPAHITNIATTGDTTISDDAANARCAFWQNFS